MLSRAKTGVSRDHIFHRGMGHAKNLLHAWWHDESGQAGVEYAVICVTGMFAAYQAAGYVGGQITDTLGHVSNVLDQINKAKF